MRSRELLSAMAMLGGVVVLGMTAQSFVLGWGDVYVESLRSAGGGRGEQSRAGSRRCGGCWRRRCCRWGW